MRLNTYLCNAIFFFHLFHSLAVQGVGPDTPKVRCKSDGPIPLADGLEVVCEDDSDFAAIKV